MILKFSSKLLISDYLITLNYSLIEQELKGLKLSNIEFIEFMLSKIIVESDLKIYLISGLIQLFNKICYEFDL